MAKQKKMKKGSALIPWGIVLIVLSFGMMFLGQLSKSVEILLLVGRVVNPIGWLMLAGGIAIAIVRSVKAKKAAKAEEKPEPKRSSGKGSKNPGFSKEEMEKYGLIEEDFEDEPRKPSRPNKLGGRREERSNGIHHKNSMKELGDKLNDISSDIECAMGLDDLIATILPKDEDDTEITFDFRPDAYDGYADLVEDLHAVGQEKDDVMQALAAVVEAVNDTKDTADDEFFGNRVVTADLLMAVSDVLFVNGLVNRAIGILYNAVGYIEKYDDGEFDDIQFVTDPDADEDENEAAVQFRLEHRLHTYVVAAKEFYIYSDFDGEEGGTPDYLEKLASLLIPEGDITYHKGLDVRLDVDFMSSPFDKFDMNEEYLYIKNMPTKRNMIDVIKEEIDSGKIAR